MYIFKLNNILMGTFYACISATLGGSTFVFTRLILPQTDAFTLCFLRYLSILVILLLIFRPKIFSTEYQAHDFLKISLLGVVYFGGFPICVAIGLILTQASDASLLFATMPIWTAFMSSLFGIDSFNRLKQLSVLLACSGIYIAISGNYWGQSFFSNFIGNLFVVGGAIFASFFTVFAGGYISKYGNILILSLTMTSGVFSMFIMMLFFGEPLTSLVNFDLVGWLIIAFLVLPGGVLMMLCWMKALELIKPIHVSICLAFNPLSAALLAFFVLNESLRKEFFLGTALVFFAIFLAQINESKILRIKNKGL